MKMQCTAERHLPTSISGEWRYNWSIDRLRSKRLKPYEVPQDSYYKHKAAFSILWLQNCRWRLKFCLWPVGTAALQGMYSAHEACCEEVFVQNKHFHASSVRSTKRWVMGMLMSVGAKNSCWQSQNDCIHEQGAKTDCKCSICKDGLVGVLKRSCK